MPAVELVSYTVDTEDIVIGTPAGGELAAVAGAVVAFEVDDFSVDGKGWSVTAVGQARVVTDPADIVRLRVGDPWVARGERPSFMRITPGTLNGHWLGAIG